MQCDLPTKVIVLIVYKIGHHTAIDRDIFTIILCIILGEIRCYGIVFVLFLVTHLIIITLFLKSYSIM